jgi:hypothetical protein
VRRIMLLTVAVVMALTLAVGTANAHEHKICTPGQGDPMLDQEPFHTQDPSNGAILNNVNATPQNYAPWTSIPYTTSCTSARLLTTAQSQWCARTRPLVLSRVRQLSASLRAVQGSLAGLGPFFTESLKGMSPEIAGKVIVLGRSSSA